MTQEAVTVLAVDDDDANRYAVSRMLRHAGYRVEEASTGAMALELASALRPDLVLLDVQLPDIDGLEVARRLRTTPATATIPIVHLTAHATSSDQRIAGLEVGAAAYLTRPVPSRELLATIASLVGVHRAEQAAHRTAREWQSTFDAIADAIYVVDREGRVTRANEAMRTLVGGALIGLAHVDVIHALLGEAGAALVAPRVSERSEREMGPTHGRSLRWTLDPIRDPSGDVDGAVGVLTDVTARRRLEAELEERNEALVLADRRKDEFLAMLGHELRNPLAAIGTAASLLAHAERPDEGERRRVGEAVGRQVRHLGKLVDGLLDVTRVTRGLIELDRVIVDLAEPVSRAVSTTEPMFTGRRHARRIALASQSLLVSGDPVRIEQVVVNLLDNAAKYTPDGGHVVVTTVREGDEAVLRITDDGVGIARENLERVYGAFTQIDPAIDRARGGLGIGLTLVKTLAEMHGGSVALSSEGLGRGTTVEVRLPIVEATAPPAPSPSEVTRPPVGASIVIVEDNDDNRELLHLALASLGYVVHDASSGIDGAELVLRVRPFCAIVDVGLPGIDGFEVARRVRASDPARAIRLVALSGYGSEADRAEARAAGFDAHLLKPIDPDVLLSAIAGASPAA